MTGLLGRHTGVAKGLCVRVCFSTRPLSTAGFAQASTLMCRFRQGIKKAVTQNLMLMVASVVYSMLSSWLPVSGKT